MENVFGFSLLRLVFRCMEISSSEPRFLKEGFMSLKSFSCRVINFVHGGEKSEVLLNCFSQIPLGSLRNHDDDDNKNPINLHI